MNLEWHRRVNWNCWLLGWIYMPDRSGGKEWWAEIYFGPLAIEVGNIVEEKGR